MPWPSVPPAALESVSTPAPVEGVAGVTGDYEPGASYSSLTPPGPTEKGYGPAPILVLDGSTATLRLVLIFILAKSFTTILSARYLVLGVQ